MICVGCHSVIYLFAKIIGGCDYYTSGADATIFVFISCSDVGTSGLTCVDPILENFKYKWFLYQSSLS